MARISPAVFHRAFAVASRNPALEQFSYEQMKQMIIKPGRPGSGFVRGHDHPWKAHTYRRASGPGSYDYEAKLEIYNRRRRRDPQGTHRDFTTLAQAIHHMGVIV